MVRALGLLAALVIGDQIRINRPGHKYRMAIEVETPDGVRSASGVVAVHPDRSYSRGGRTRTAGDAVYVDLGRGKNLVALLAHVDEGKVDLDGSNYVALRAYTAASGVRVSFNQMSRPLGRGAGQRRADPGAGLLCRSCQSRQRAHCIGRRCRRRAGARCTRSGL